MRTVLVAGAILVGGCGGGEDGDEADFLDDLFDVLWDAAARPTLEIVEPSDESYETTADRVRIAGTSSEDGGITWSNDAGAHGDINTEWDWCLFFCAHEWSTTVPLSIGHNVITVVAANDSGAAVATLEITRKAHWGWMR